ncbi:5-(carboxyamino)imidazole ribonucleotide mutase [bacterium (Candidatus Gribaldobacteria) CG_4_10_14_0_2_um_filter_41_16]|uniref:N5-carboxyaminoimidazole ribonucleotide mutase n=1 Tax=bacterium (Candidatus Gribaldobacteria) CG_4_10_14_0_2_um_filter_41_16 TaxID=2014265 RepID=A0A2M7VJ58_9BACT|nr:MAG: 5-(carboxyamino)imidazole ribonucleotide mutase [bacterium (Candidatus Gribaldobacteria) CG_4_10_14_0_2_um_filter_41_16]
MSVGIIMGSDSDVPVVEKAKEVLEKFGIPFAATIRSAHRTPYDVQPIVTDWEVRGCQVFITAAGAAAHLAGAIASLTDKPVIAISLATENQTAVNGLDALLSSVMMPTGIPVATMAINGAANAALFAIKILALNDSAIQQKLREYRANLVSKTREKMEKLKESGWPD